jgi:hypothetical protein
MAGSKNDFGNRFARYLQIKREAHPHFVNVQTVSPGYTSRNLAHPPRKSVSKRQRKYMVDAKATSSF